MTILCASIQERWCKERETDCTKSAENVLIVGGFGMAVGVFVPNPRPMALLSGPGRRKITELHSKFGHQVLARRVNMRQKQKHDRTGFLNEKKMVPLEVIDYFPSRLHPFLPFARFLTHTTVGRLLLSFHKHFLRKGMVRCGIKMG